MFKLNHKLTFILLTLILVFVGGCGSETGGERTPTEDSENSTSPEAEENIGGFYEGKKFEILVPYGTGGGTDTLGRLVAPYLEKHLAGNPQVYVTNVPGGGGVTGANQFVQQNKNDGLHSLLTSSSATNPYLLGQSTVQFDLSELKPVIGFPTGSIVYTSTSTGIEEPKDILDPDEPFIYAGITASGGDLALLLTFELLGMDVETHFGYDGSGATRVAFEQGESNINQDSPSSYIANIEPLVESGQVQPLFTFGLLDEEGNLQRDPAFPDLPTLEEFYIEVHGEEPSGEVWEAFKALNAPLYSVQKVLFVHGDIPEEALHDLEQAAASLVTDEEFITEGEETLGGYTPLAREGLQNIIDSAYDISEETVQFLHRYLKEEHGVSVE